MNVFIVGSPLETAMALDKKRLNKQIIENNQILNAIYGRKAWRNHPCTLQYKDLTAWLCAYSLCLEDYRDKNMEDAEFWSNVADSVRPSFHTEEFFSQMKRRLYTKNKAHYSQWADLGESFENWYWSPGEQKIIKYVNGKRQD